MTFVKIAIYKANTMLGKFILEQRKKRDLNQEYLATLLGLSRPTYMQIEQSERDLTISQAMKLAEVFNMTLEDFLAGKEVLIQVDVRAGSKKSKPEQKEIRISIPQERVDKFRQVLLYILRKVGGKSNVGMTAIYKFLYFIDFDYYEKYEEQLMGLVFIKNHYGPTPVVFTDVIKQMTKAGEVEAVKSKFYQYPQIKYLVNPEIEPDLTVLNGKEKEHIDAELRRLSDMTAVQLSELSHRDVPWISAENGKPLDYEAVFYRTPETSVRNYDESRQA